MQFGVDSIILQFRVLFGTSHLTIGQGALFRLFCSVAANDKKMGAIENDIVTISPRVQVANLAPNLRCRVQFADSFYRAARVAAKNVESTIRVDNWSSIDVEVCFIWDKKTKKLNKVKLNLYP